MKATSLVLLAFLPTLCFGSLWADYNNDGIVNFVDFAAFSAHWLEEDPNQDDLSDAGFLDLVYVPYKGPQLRDKNGDPITKPIYVEPFDDIGPGPNQWKPHSSSTSVTADADYYSCGTQAMRISSIDDTTAFAFAKRVLPTSIPADLESSHIKIRYHLNDPQTLDPNDDPENISYGALYLFDSNDNYRLWVILTRIQSTEYKGEWVTYICGKYTSIGQSSTDLNWTDICKIQVLLRLKAEQFTSSLTLDSIEFWPAASHGYYCLTFDDGYTSAKHKIGYAIANGIPVTIFVIGEKIGAPGYLSWRELEDFHKTGMVAICNKAEKPFDEHTYNFSLMSKAEKYREIRSMGRKLIAHGFAEGAGVFAIPGNVYQSYKIRDEQDYFGGLCSVVRRSYPEVGMYQDFISYTEPAMLWRLEPYEDPNEMTNHLDQVIEHGMLMVAGFYSPDFQAFKDHIEAVKARIDAGKLIAVKATQPFGTSY
ncbi:MAG: polysaccharide deacetylase family protein [Planctomycetota bacterium]